MILHPVAMVGNIVGFESEDGDSDMSKTWSVSLLSVWLHPKSSLMLLLLLASLLAGTGLTGVMFVG